jgi:hypothetical protein
MKSVVIRKTGPIASVVLYRGTSGGGGGTGAVNSVNGKTGTVSLALADLPTDPSNRTVSDAEKANWNAGGGGVAGVSSVNARSGAVVLAKADVGLANVDNTSDASKPVSSATQTALNAKQDALGFTAVPITRTVAGKALSANISLSGSDVGLGNVPNLAFSGSNTGDETAASIKTKLGISTLSGANTGDQIIPRQLTIAIDSADIITAGEKRASIVCPISGTITRWRLLSDVATNAVVSIWKANGARPTVSGIITGTAKPTLAAAQVASSTALTGWTIAVTAGDVFVVSVDSNTAAKFLSVCLEII